MSTNTSTNGQARKSLAEQIDRLDAMLDGLADGLNDAVAMVVKEAVGVAVKEAVQAVLREALSSPELLARLHAAATPAAPTPAPAVAPKQSKVSWQQRWASACKALAAYVAAARAVCGRRLGQVRRWAIGVGQHVLILGRFKYQFLTALGVGAAAGVGAYFAGPWLAAATSAVGGFAVALAVQAGLILKRLINQAAGSAA